MLKKSLIYRDYCTGCGLCKTYAGVQLRCDSKGFRYPENINEDQSLFCGKVCMSSGSFWNDTTEIHPWGTTIGKPVYAYAEEERVRFNSSSGGVVTTCAKYLLQNGIVDGVIQIQQSNNNVLKTNVICSTSCAEIEASCGSRYTISAPFDDFKSIINPEKRYAFIGKPCDVMALRNYSRINKDINKSIVFYISFFCAGIPSYTAGERLLKKMGSSSKSCRQLIYRGNGWPGYTTCVDESGAVNKITYNESWGQILGRDIARCCRFCLDGIGEAADISCGDGWYIKDGKPDFSEHQGRNIVFCRTRRGRSLFDEIVKAGDVIIDSECTHSDLKTIQNYQYIRRSTMIDKMNALAFMHRPVPEYDKKLLRPLEAGATVKGRLRIFLGTCKRIHSHKI